ncbi:hypothetical protein I4U23_022494 [Adineta vaga]|nr:hypothetical protein I4U23_022494 [Adineta vaga]
MSSATPLIRSITIYTGLPIFICGAVGNLLNLRLLWPTRHNSCAFIFLTLSFVNCIVLFYGLFTRILSVGFGLDWSPTNIGWCKTRVPFIQSSTLISFSCICLASIDRFLITCRQEKYRKWSRLSTARWAVAVAVFIWIGHAIPYIVYYQIVASSSSSNTTSFTCSLISETSYNNYRTYFVLPVFYGLIPTTVLTVMGVMTYRNINTLQLGRQRQAVQQHLTLMLLVQIPIIIGSTIPYVVFTEYLTLTATVIKSADQVTRENIINNIVNPLFYITFACPFFVFFISSPTFRQETMVLLLCRPKERISNNRIQPCVAPDPALTTKPISNIK